MKNKQPNSNPSTKPPKARANVTVGNELEHLTTLKTAKTDRQRARKEDGQPKERPRKREDKEEKQQANDNRPVACRQEQERDQGRLLSTSNTNGVCPHVKESQPLPQKVHKDFTLANRNSPSTSQQERRRQKDGQRARQLKQMAIPAGGRRLQAFPKPVAFSVAGGFLAFAPL